jgi:hypothetical protein
VWPGSRPATGFSLRDALRDSFGRGRSPLWRPLDRSRSRAQALLVLGLLGAVLFSCVMAGRGLGAADRRARSEAARLHSTRATVVGPIAANAAGAASRLRAGELVWVVWSYPAGRNHAARIEVARPVEVGTALPIWVTDEGWIADAPRGTAAFVILALGTAATVWLGLTLAVLLVYGLHHRLLDFRARRFWAAGWAAVEPDWSGRLRGRPDRS